MLEALTAMNAVTITQSDSAVINPPLKFLVISGVGTVVYKNEKDETITFVVPAVADGGRYPFILPGRIRQIMDTNTTIANAQLHGLR